MQWFAVTVNRTVLRRVEQDATVEVEAEDAAEAKKKVEQMLEEDWECDIAWLDDDGSWPDEEVEDFEVVEVEELEPEEDPVQITLADGLIVRVLSKDGKELTAEEVKRALAAADQQFGQAADTPAATVDQE